MQPKNQSEIKFSFYKFLLLFLITIGLFWGLAYWNIASPVYTSKLLQDHNEVLINEISFQRKFNGFLRMYLDSMAYYERHNRCQDYRRLKRIINTLRLELGKNKIYHQKSMYDSTIAALNIYHEAKEKTCNHQISLPITSTRIERKHLWNRKKHITKPIASDSTSKK